MERTDTATLTRKADEHLISDLQFRSGAELVRRASDMLQYGYDVRRNMHPSTVKWDSSLLSRIAPHDLESLANMQAEYDPSHFESARSHIHLLTKSGGEVTKALLSASIASGYEARPPDSEVDLRKRGQDLARALNTRLGMEKKADVQLLEYWHKTLCPTSAQQSPNSHEPFQLLALLRDVDAGDDRSLLDLVLDASRLNGTDLPLSKKVDEEY